MYRPFLSFKFSIDGYAMGQRRYRLSWSRPGWEYTSKLKYHGFNLKWDVPNELYKGDLSRPYLDENGALHKNMY